MAPARPFEPAHEDVVGRVEEQDPYPVTGPFEGIEEGRNVLDVLAAPAPHYEGDPLGLRAGAADEVGHLGDQRGREVVDDKPPQVLQGGGGGGPPGARHAGHDQELAHARSVSPTGAGGAGDRWARGGGRPAGPCSAANTASATASGNQVRARSSSSEAALSALTPPISFRSRPRRAGPSPGASSRTLVVIRLPRRSRWKVMAKRWASSRTRWSR